MQMLQGQEKSVVALFCFDREGKQRCYSACDCLRQAFFLRRLTLIFRIEAHIVAVFSVGQWA